ncbi:hypothetical protein TorRG33x02_273650, partial [Trema orientale]
DCSDLPLRLLSTNILDLKTLLRSNSATTTVVSKSVLNSIRIYHRNCSDLSGKVKLHDSSQGTFTNQSK